MWTVLDFSIRSCEILSYNSSVLNPLLKIVVPLLFSLTAGYFFASRMRYGGLLQQIATLLFLDALALLISSLFRLEGDFNAQYKWGESAFALISAAITLFIAVKVRNRLQDIAGVFESGKEGED